MPGPRGDGSEIWAWQVQDEDGGWSIICTVLNGVLTPMFDSHPFMLQELKPKAEQFAAERGKRLRLARFALVAVPDL